MPRRLAPLAIMMALVGCQDGATVPGPGPGSGVDDDGTTPCGGGSIDFASDPLNCGACENACSSEEVCSRGECARGCDEGLSQCGQSCVDVLSSADHCGRCDNACTDGAVCSRGECIASASDVDYINEAGRVDDEGLGIHGDWYAFSDGVTSTQTGNPYRDGAYCVSGEAPGDEAWSEHWGVGIGFDLNSMGGQKLPYAFEGRINGFRVKVEGSSPVPPRFHFVNDPEAEATPFTQVTYDASKDYWIAEGQVPFDWDVATAGQRVDNGELYSIQVLAPGADAPGPIEFCITEFEPIYDPDHGGPTVDSSPYINADAFIRPENNPFGIQGPVYAIGDGNSTSQIGNPYQDGKYCIAGEFSGADADWGAGIAIDFNRVPGADRQPYTHEGKIEGFHIALGGQTPGDARIQFIVNEPQDGNQPFLVALPNTTMDYRIDWGQVPASWDVPEAGNEVGESFYTLQLYLDGGTPGPFEVCIEEFVPVTTAELVATAEPALTGYNGARTIDAAILQREYDIWKARHFRDCNNGTACVPRDQGDCISEGVAYGMLLSVAFDDRDAFDKLWAYYEAHKNGAGVMDWQTNACGNTIGTGSASDGELDAAMALIQASCRWGGNYENEARDLIGAIRNSEVTTCNNLTVLKPGSGFGGCNEANPSYFAPGYYRVFQTLTGDNTWNNLINDGYTWLATLQSRKNGLVPDWADMGGNPQAGERGDYGPDASRTPWRVATDYVWNAEPRAITFLDNVSSYVDENGGVARLFTPNSNFRGGLAFSAVHQDPVKAQAYVDAWLTTAADDGSYFPGTLRPIYMLLAAQQFSDTCN